MPKPHLKHTVATLSALVLSALTLAGCSGGPGGGGEQLKAEDSPLSKYLMAIYSQSGYPVDGTQEEQQAFYNEQQRKVEELVAQCMTKEGFDYVPNTANTSVVISDEEDNPWKPDDREWVSKYGYGAVNYPGRDEQPAPEASAPADPNQSYVEGLSEAEQQAYYEVLYGKGDSEPNEDGEYEYKWENAGCQGWAQHEISGDNFWEQEEHKPLIEALNKFYETMQSDPSYAEIDAAWSTCMAEAGHEGFAKQSEAQESIYTLINAYYEKNQPAEGAEDQVDENFGTPKDPEYAKIAETEIPLALADLDCREKTDYRQRQLKAQFALEEQFIADHSEELDALKTSTGQGK